jgi:hypothetical protein
MVSIEIISMELGRIREIQSHHGSQLQKLLDQQAAMNNSLDRLRETASTQEKKSSGLSIAPFIRPLQWIGIIAVAIYGMITGTDIGSILSTLVK